jgi:hypothetical protein
MGRTGEIYLNLSSLYCLPEPPAAYAGTGSPVRCSTIFSAMLGGTSS